MFSKDRKWKGKERRWQNEAKEQKNKRPASQFTFHFPLQIWRDYIPANI